MHARVSIIIVREEIAWKFRVGDGKRDTMEEASCGGSHSENQERVIEEIVYHNILCT